MKRWVFIIGVFAVVAFFLASGCAHVSEVTYPEGSRVSPVPEKVRLLPDYDDKRRLAIALALPSTNSVPISVSLSESWLADAKGHRYRLALEPLLVGGRDMTEGQLWSWYRVSAFATNAPDSRLVFRKGSYSISVVYTAQGARQVAERQFAINRYSIPYPIVWVVWLFNPHGN
jgi:hypothetical protein